MPSLTNKQHNAMAAAAAGNSTLGIPRKVGKEFMMADALRAKGKPTRKYGGSNAGGASIGGGT